RILSPAILTVFEQLLGQRCSESESPFRISPDFRLYRNLIRSSAVSCIGLTASGAPPCVLVPWPRPVSYRSRSFKPCCSCSGVQSVMLLRGGGRASAIQRHSREYARRSIM